MTTGLPTTFRLLTKTSNEMAVRVLVAALDSPVQAIQEGALLALLARHSAAGHREILRRLPTINDRWKFLIRQNQGDMTRTLRDAVLADDADMCRNACQAAVWFHQFDLVPVLLSALEDPARPNAEMAAATLLELAGQLYEELAAGRDRTDRRNPQLLRRHIISSLESSIGRFARHKRREVVEAFLLLVPHDNVVLQHILQDPHHSVFLVVMDLLANSSHGGIIRLLLSFLDDPHVPSAALTVIANRSDVRFVQYLLRKIGRAPAAGVAQNLKRIESVAWIQSGGSLMDQLDETAQCAAVRLLMDSGVPRLQSYPMIEWILTSGKPVGRREAAAALGQFHGAEANSLAVRMLDDPDPQVQANVVLQLRSRGIPGILPRLLQMLDSPHAVVRKSARQSLAEFTFDRLLTTFDMLDEEVRRSTAMLVKKIDPQTVPRLREELESPVRSRRLRALAIVRATETIDALEESVATLLQDEDHVVRAAAASALAWGTATSSYEALQAARNDRSPSVQEAVRRSLYERDQLVPW